MAGMRQSRSKCNIFGQARIPGDLPLRELVGATLCGRPYLRNSILAQSVYLPEGRHPIIPIFQHSTIPIAERSGAKF